MTLASFISGFKVALTQKGLNVSWNLDDALAFVHLLACKQSTCHQTHSTGRKWWLYYIILTRAGHSNKCSFSHSGREHFEGNVIDSWALRGPLLSVRACQDRRPTPFFHLTAPHHIAWHATFFLPVFLWNSFPLEQDFIALLQLCRQRKTARAVWDAGDAGITVPEAIQGNESFSPRFLSFSQVWHVSPGTT